MFISYLYRLHSRNAVHILTFFFQEDLDPDWGTRIPGYGSFPFPLWGVRWAERLERHLLNELTESHSWFLILVGNTRVCQYFWALGAKKQTSLCFVGESRWRGHRGWWGAAHATWVSGGGQTCMLLQREQWASRRPKSLCFFSHKPWWDFSEMLAWTLEIKLNFDPYMAT